MVTYPPYLPSIKWWKKWLEALMENKTGVESVIIANGASISSRDVARARLKDSIGRELTLSVAVEGGARLLRNPERAGTIRLSEHGNWRHVHQQALETIYGKFPFYPHYSSALKRIYGNRELTTLGDFTYALHNAMAGMILGSLDDGDIKLIKGNPILYARGREISSELDAAISALDPVMKFGPEAILGILCSEEQREL